MGFNRFLLPVLTGKLDVVVLCQETIWGIIFDIKYSLVGCGGRNRSRKLEPEYLIYVFDPKVK